MTLLRACLVSIVLTSLGAGGTTRAQGFQSIDPQQVLLRVDPAPLDGKAEPRTLAQALTRAQAWIDEGRRKSEPRGFGRAEALLERWHAQGAANAQWHVLSADIQQYRHEFDRSLASLGRALELEPSNARALLMRAAVRQTRGEFDAARTDCSALLAQGEVALGSTCLAQILGLTGRLARARALLERQAREDTSTAEIRVWRLGALADMADRSGDVAAAERHLRQALQIQPHDQYISLALVDLLLLQGRPAEVETLLQSLPLTEAVLLRRAEALRAAPRAKEEALTHLQALRTQARRRGEALDLRDEVRLQRLQGRSCEALKAARSNWASQREPQDVRLLLAAGNECYDPDVIEEVRRWLAATRYQDIRLQTLLRTARPS